ncbi:BirA family biotin operon repressor/biotin-[acetyl-CoA-carboxylase] ligase [Rhodoligotrophos appendicifer]|uniref:biotin--[acetyl-CoA-carboxylase] ligase n=1 Tax=Rhodoligotrophos appendicifer TaxID=987056 RepID=UPI00118518A5|nr:biotin--[acetyl-CoA-carboxylase] ligase [Rhodoligotrophos appendicifer]
MQRISLPFGHRLAQFDEVDSTNAEAIRQAASGEVGPLWIVAQRQSAGRGRQGRPWTSESGNFYGSLLLTDRSAPARSANLSFVAALALFDAASACVSETRRSLMRLKWPNDLLIDGAKTSGILLEAAPRPHFAEAGLVIGIGVNLTRKPPGDLPYKTTCLAEHGAEDGPLAFLEHLAQAFDRWHMVWSGPEGFAGIRRAWLSRAQGLGGPLLVRMQGEQIEGIFADLDDEGALLLQMRGGATRRVLAGDVFFS